MITPESLKITIEQGMVSTHVSTAGDGRHFELLVVSEEFAGKNRLQRQQHIYKVLGDSMRDEKIHALTMKTFTPQEWQEKA
jgi:acid stress-induced BolA-like protein IbaG/YrbA